MSRTERLVGILRQMLETVRRRTPTQSPHSLNEETNTILRQRRYAEWLCDNDINAFRTYTHPALVGTRVLPLSGMVPPLTWGYRSRDRDTLYHGSRPFVFYVPSTVKNIALCEADDGRHNLTLELAPLALHDVLALDLLASFARPITNEFPRAVVIDTTIPSQDDRIISDMGFGLAESRIPWADIIVDDYLLPELTVSRLPDTNEGWTLVFNMLNVTRLATSP